MAKEIRSLFLKEFTKNLILNSKKPAKELFPYHPVKQPPFSEIQEYPLQTITSKQPTQRMVPSIKSSDMKIPTVIPSAQITEFKPAKSITSEKVNPAIAEITPFPQPLPKEFSLGKLDSLLSDKTITVIECAGPGKLVIVKSLGKIVPTRIILSEQEIKNIVETFSKYAKIPVIRGIFKAAIGNLVITAVLSDFVGSRFIVNKYTPYSIIESQM